VRAPVWINRRQPGNSRFSHLLPQYDLRVHVGIILPNYDEHATPDGDRAVAEAAEELGFSRSSLDCHEEACRLDQKAVNTGATRSASP
jgi:hypothetical protein